MDMILTIDVPDGVGHNYGKDSVRAWLSLIGPAGLSPEEIAELERIIAAAAPEDD